MSRAPRGTYATYITLRNTQPGFRRNGNLIIILAIKVGSLRRCTQKTPGSLRPQVKSEINFGDSFSCLDYILGRQNFHFLIHIYRGKIERKRLFLLIKNYNQVIAFDVSLRYDDSKCGMMKRMNH